MQEFTVTWRYAATDPQYDTQPSKIDTVRAQSPEAAVQIIKAMHVARIDVITVTAKPDDSAALDRIASQLDGCEWDADTIEHVANIVRGTGRVIRDVGEGS